MDDDAVADAVLHGMHVCLVCLGKLARGYATSGGHSGPHWFMVSGPQRSGCFRLSGMLLVNVRLSGNV